MKPINGWLTIRISESFVPPITNQKRTNVTEDLIICDCNNGGLSLDGVDTVISALGTVPHNPLAEELDKLAISYKVIGDAEKVGKIFEAVAAGRRVGMQI